MSKHCTAFAFLLFFQITVLPQPYITVTYPNGGEVLCGGTSQSITWEDNITENVEIQLFKSGVFHSSITTSTPSDGEYAWSIPNPSPSLSGLKIRIVSADDSNIFDFSDSTFSFGCSINIISPNGGEIWQAGTTETIIWTGDHLENVTIDLYKGGVFYSVLLTTTASDTSQFWDIPINIVSGSDYKVKITSVDVPGVSDFSDSNFTILRTDSLTVTSPNGGEAWLAGTSHTIIWESNVGGDVIIELYKGGVFHSIITGPTPNDGFYDWEISFTTISGRSDYRVKIISVDNPNIFDISDFDFTIFGNSINLISPNGGEEWYAGTIERIIWTAAYPIEIQLFKGGIFHSIIEPPNSEGIGAEWFIPSDIEPGSDYKIKIVSVTGDNVFDFSDSNFTILRTDSITVTSPNGFENWMMGSTQDIIWTSNNVENVKIELSLFEGYAWETIVDSIPSTGLYSWVVNASGPSFYCLMRISDITNENIFDVSDDVFTIDIFPSVEDYFGDVIPVKYELIQNYPNPFNPSTTIYYALPQAGNVELIIFDVLGNEVMNFREEQAAGYHKFEFYGNDSKSGVYFYRLQAGGFVETKKMILIK